MGALFLFFYWEDGGWGYAGQMKIFFFEDFWDHKIGPLRALLKWSLKGAVFNLLFFLKAFEGILKYYILCMDKVNALDVVWQRPLLFRMLYSFSARPFSVTCRPLLKTTQMKEHTHDKDRDQARWTSGAF
jgi:hypothetical protein